jgi:hypothetical protein
LYEYFNFLKRKNIGSDGKLYCSSEIANLLRKSYENTFPKMSCHLTTGCSQSDSWVCQMRRMKTGHLQKVSKEKNFFTSWNMSFKYRLFKDNFNILKLLNYPIVFTSFSVSNHFNCNLDTWMDGGEVQLYTLKKSQGRFKELCIPFIKSLL